MKTDTYADGSPRHNDPPRMEDNSVNEEVEPATASSRKAADADGVDRPRPAHGRHLSNIYDHRKLDARMYHTQMAGPEAMGQDWLQHLEWIRRNIIDRPKATETYTAEQLEAMGMIGIYAPLASSPDTNFENTEG